MAKSNKRMINHMRRHLEALEIEFEGIDALKDELENQIAVTRAYLSELEDAENGVRQRQSKKSTTRKKSKKKSEAVSEAA